MRPGFTTKLKGVNTVATVDYTKIREDIGEKTRVHIFAKQLGISSRELMLILDEIGIVRVPQSNLRKDEALAALNKLEQQLNDAQPEQNTVKKVEKSAKTSPKKTKKKVVAAKAVATANGDTQEVAEVDKKLRHRVEKNVENEINQIERKVDREVVGTLVEKEIHEIEEEVDTELAGRISSQPEPTSAPLIVAPSYDSIFKAPVILDEDAVDDDIISDFSEDDKEVADIKKKRRGRRGTGRGRGITSREDDGDSFSEDNEEEELISEPRAIRGSTRLEAQRRRRQEMREEQQKKRHIVSEAEFLARRESVTRTMVVRERERYDHPGVVTQVGVLEDDMLVEHFVTSDSQSSMVGNIYLGRVQNVLPSMEAAFIDIGRGRNAVLYAGEVNWHSHGLGGRNRKIEQALKSGEQVLVQVSKDPLGHKGARLTTQISLAGRYLVYVPGGRSAGISRKLPAPERHRLKGILKRVVPSNGGVIIRTAAEGVSEQAIAADVNRLHNLWEQIQQRTVEANAAKGAKPETLYEEPNMLVKVIRDLFNEDFSSLIVDGERAWNTVHAYISSVAPDLVDRLEHFDREKHKGKDAFEVYRVDEQLQKALSRKVWLPSGGTLVIDRTEAMTVIDVNTGKFTGAGGNLEETVTKNNLEAAEEIVRQMRLRDLGGMIVVDFIDMVLPENQDLVLRRLKEALGRDRTRHQISEVTSLGLVQITRKRLGTGLLETFATECEHCEGRGVIIHDDPIEQHDPEAKARKRGVRHQVPTEHPVAIARKTRERSLEDLAASVVLQENSVLEESEEPKETSAFVAEKEAEDTPSRSDSSKTRSRRRSHRVNRNKEAMSDSTDIAAMTDIVDSAVERAEQQDPDDISFAQTYDEAIAEFEASPRRKRKVRGNSASDHRPEKADFEIQSKPSIEDVAQHSGEQEENDTSDTIADAPKVSATRRRRRRAVRVAEHAKINKQTQVSHDSSRSSVTKENVSGSRASKRRRRVVRRRG
ncbi:Rne/Rng family ribonuclease [Corynebacterium kutscheri]|uniref:Rne/Rng family ribonuclease n=1 Tax=Corynebacterium kutscheri TaxID=35755 RepID=UPI000A01A32A